MMAKTRHNNRVQATAGSVSRLNRNNHERVGMLSHKAARLKRYLHLHHPVFEGVVASHGIRHLSRRSGIARKLP
jgi:hypothetical protein